MTAPYRRTRAQQAHDLDVSRDWEEHVEGVLGKGTVLARFSSTNDLDVWVPGYFLELKEKNQRYGERWHLLPGVEEADLFVMDELTIRRGLDNWPYVFFLVRDNPGGGRLVWMPIWELISTPRVRRQRVGKGKWIINLAGFRTLESEQQIREVATADLLRVPWRKPGIQSSVEVPQI